MKIFNIIDLIKNKERLINRNKDNFVMILLIYYFLKFFLMMFN